MDKTIETLNENRRTLEEAVLQKIKKFQDFTETINEKDRKENYCICSHPTETTDNDTIRIDYTGAICTFEKGRHTEEYNNFDILSFGTSFLVDFIDYIENAKEMIIIEIEKLNQKFPLKTEERV